METLESPAQALEALQTGRLPALNMPIAAINRQSGEILVGIPPTCAEQIFYTREAAPGAASAGLLLSNDLRLLRNSQPGELDERAVFALLQYRAVPPPLSLFKRIQRLPYGCLARLRPGESQPALQPAFEPPAALPADAPPETLQEQIQARLDEILGSAPQGAALYFSGGVDSGLMAARLAALGRGDVRLINYIFTPGEEAGQNALQMAERLGFACAQALYQPEQLPGVFERLPLDYSFPFGDLSLTPTNLLAHASLQTLGDFPAVLEGTGGDGGFGMAGMQAEWQAYYRLPPALRQLLAAAYPALGAWKNSSGLETRLRKWVRAAAMPLEQAAIIGNTSLEGSAYRTPGDVRRFWEQALEQHLLSLGAGLAPDGRMSLVDLVHVCAGRYVPKSAEPLRRAGVRGIYPFLEPGLLELSLAIPPQAKQRGGKKALLKQLLARRLPPELVYRRKLGFAPPTRRLLALPSVQDQLSQALSANSPLYPYLRARPLGEMATLARREDPLSLAAQNMLWLLAFTNTWLAGLPAAGRQA
jgi:asparagine synthetase B (glutamine-hydrolysing)